jgi:hydroxyacylglutathione hydrolase
MDNCLQIHTLVSMPFGENTYVVWRKDRKEALVFDPGLQPEMIMEFIQDQELTPVTILNTHGHCDHIGGNQTLKDQYPDAPLIIGVNDAPLLGDPNLNLSALMGIPVYSPPADRLLRERNVVETAGIRLEVLDVPGHSPGHIVFLYRDDPCLLFGGDVLFRAGIGRTDFPNGDGPLLMQGIKTKVLTLPPTTVVYPGHGPVTTVKHEKENNPFVGRKAEKYSP